MTTQYKARGVQVTRGSVNVLFYNERCNQIETVLHLREIFALILTYSFSRKRLLLNALYMHTIVTYVISLAEKTLLLNTRNIENLRIITACKYWSFYAISTLYYQ